MGNIVIVGPRSSGKTTYLAALSYLPKLIQEKSKKNRFTVEAVNDDAIKLQTKAENLIRSGISLSPTNVPTAFQLPSYSFQIEIKQESLNLVVKDYAGEIFDSLDSSMMQKEHEEYWEECFRKDQQGCLLLLVNWQKSNDREYSQKIKYLIKLLDYHQRNDNFRIAVVMSKCERGELWSGRIEPEIDIFKAHLPETKSILEKSINPNNFKFYALSSFGVLDRHRDPRPNRIDDQGTDDEFSILREPDAWEPYNLIAPLYWLSTGKNMKAHDY